MREATLPAEGSTVELSYTASHRPFKTGRQSVEAEVREVTGEIVYLDNPFEGYNSPTLVVDPDDNVWARSEDGKDGLFGTNARFE